MRNHDLTFLKHFSQMIAGLAVLTIVLILFANWIYWQQPSEPNHAAEAATEARIAPLGGVYAGDTGAAAMAAAAEEARKAAASQVAYGGTLDGGEIYGQLCGTCHETGAGGAPTLVHANWDARVAQGIETLIKHSVDGFQGDAGLMPARGGNPSLSDEQMEATVRWMVDNLK
ncbi:MAG: c-type cytochrome [Lysobacteraceae bacterium]